MGETLLQHDRENLPLKVVLETHMHSSVRMLTHTSHTHRHTIINKSTKSPNGPEVTAQDAGQGQSEDV